MKTQSLAGPNFGLNSARSHSVPSFEALLRPLLNSTGLLSRAWRWIRSRQDRRSSARRLQVAATVSLGEKRFAAVIQVDGLQFLIGGGATNVTLLAQLHPKDSFEDMLKETMTVPKKQPVKRARKQNVKSAAEQKKVQA